MFKNCDIIRRLSIEMNISWLTEVEGDLKAPFLMATTPQLLFPGLRHLHLISTL